MTVLGSRKSVFSVLFFLLLTQARLAQTGIAQSTTNETQATRSEEDQRAYRTAMEQADEKIAAEVKARSELMKNLEYLTTEIAARSPASHKRNGPAAGHCSASKTTGS